MNNNRSYIIRLAAACFCSLSVILYSGYSFLFKNEAAASADKHDFTEFLPPNYEKEFPDFTAPEKNEVNSAPPQSSAPASKPSIPVIAPSKATGKVSERFISPYTANTSFGSVYLKNSTDHKIDIKQLLREKLPYRIESGSAPQVLIVHTHTTEAFMHEARDYYTDKDLARTLNQNYSVVRLGNIITEKLNSAGIKTVHDTTLHDYPEYNGSYDRAAATIKKNLRKYPGIKVVIDLHRDAIGSKEARIKPVTKIGGRKAAQIMLVMGSQGGYVKNFPDWKENLKLAVRFQQNLESMYPSLARALSFMPRLYNENLTKGSMLLEIGTEANSIDEAVYSAELASEALIKTLKAIK